MTFLVVEWIDSGLHIDHGWGKKEQYMAKGDIRVATVTTAGILMDETDEVVAIALSYDPDNDQWLGAQLIYKKNIVKRTVLA